MLVYATELMVSQRFASELASLKSDVDVVVLPPPCPIGVQPTDFGHAESLMSRAEETAHIFLSGRAGTVVPLHGSRAPSRRRAMG
jgi:NTE family protein